MNKEHSGPPSLSRARLMAHSSMVIRPARPAILPLSLLEQIIVSVAKVAPKLRPVCIPTVVGSALMTFPTPIWGDLDGDSVVVRPACPTIMLYGILLCPWRKLSPNSDTFGWLLSSGFGMFELQMLLTPNSLKCTGIRWLDFKCLRWSFLAGGLSA